MITTYCGFVCTTIPWRRHWHGPESSGLSSPNQWEDWLIPADPDGQVKSKFKVCWFNGGLLFFLFFFDFMDLFGIYPLVNEDTGFMRFLVSFPMKVSQVGVPLEK